MSAEIINLRRERKIKQRKNDEATAVENRARFGVTKMEKEKSAAQKAIDGKNLDGHHRER